MRRIGVLDANVLIRYLDREHRGHASAVRLLRRARLELYINELNLAEVLVRAITIGNDGEVWEAVTREMGVTPWGDTGRDWVTHLARTRATSAPRLPTPDAVVLATALQIGGQVVSFDEELRAAARNKRILYQTDH